jgi:hypothetical protein
VSSLEHRVVEKTDAILTKSVRANQDLSARLDSMFSEVTARIDMYADQADKQIATLQHAILVAQEPRRTGGFQGNMRQVRLWISCLLLRCNLSRSIIVRVIVGGLDSDLCSSSVYIHKYHHGEF